MAEFFSATQRVKFGSAAGRRAARARSKKIEFTGWAQSRRSPRRADHERPLCGEIEGSDVLKELPKFSLGSYAHSSIRVQEGQRISEVFKAKGASDFKVVKRCRDQRDSNLACVIDSSNFFRSPA